eukprot:5782030-Prymnesium_polylepis.1
MARSFRRSLCLRCASSHSHKVQSSRRESAQPAPQWREARGQTGCTGRPPWPMVAPGAVRWAVVVAVVAPVALLAAEEAMVGLAGARVARTAANLVVEAALGRAEES